jgi:hypothetical protein
VVCDGELGPRLKTLHDRYGEYAPSRCATY